MKNKISWGLINIPRDKTKIDFVAQEMVRGVYFSVTGPRFYGKTSFLRQVMEGLKKSTPHYRCCFLDIPELLSFTRPDLLINIRSQISVILNGQNDKSDYPNEDPLDSIYRICTNTNERLFIFVANIDHLDDETAVDLLSAFRAISQEQMRSKYITVAISGSKNLLEWTFGKTSPWNIAKNYPIEPLNIDEIMCLNSDLKKSFGFLFDVEQSAAEELLKETGGHPYIVFKIIQMALNTNQTISKEFINSVIIDILTMPPNHDSFAKAIFSYIEEREDVYEVLMYNLQYRKKVKKYEKRNLELTGIFKYCEELPIKYKFSNLFLEKCLKRHYHPVAAGDLSVLHGRWDIAKKCYEMIDKKRRIMLSSKRYLFSRNRIADMVKHFVIILWRYQNPEKVLDVFLDGLDLMLNLTNAYIYVCDPGRGHCKLEKSIAYNNNLHNQMYFENNVNHLISRAHYEQKVVYSTDIRSAAIPIKSGTKRRDRILYVELLHHDLLNRDQRRFLINDISDLAFSANMARERAIILRSLKDSYHNVKNELKSIYKKQSVLTEIISYVQRDASLKKKIYFILTALTIKNGLEFNRAMLFLLDNSKKYVYGEMAIGSINEKQQKELGQDPFFDNISVALSFLWNDFDNNQHIYTDNELTKKIRNIKYSMNKHYNKLTSSVKVRDPHICGISTEEVIYDDFIKQIYTDQKIPQDICFVPLSTNNETIGVIWLDNIFSPNIVDERKLGLAQVFALQASVVISQSILNEQEKNFIKTTTHELRIPVQCIDFAVNEMEKNAIEEQGLGHCCPIESQKSQLGVIVAMLLSCKAVFHEFSQTAFFK